MHTSRLAVLAPILAAGLIAGCGSSSSSTTSAQPAAATTQSSSVAASAPSGGHASPAALVTTKHNKLGTVLAYGPKRLTVYLFERDSGPHSTCNGACAEAWPPVIGKPSAKGGAVATDLGTTKRADGKLQVTYKGHPLYGFIKDKDDEDAYGQGVKAFGAEWYVLAPSGSKIDTEADSADSNASSSSSSSGSSGSGSGGGGGY